MAVWAGGDDRVVGTTTTNALRDGGNMIPVSVYHSAFCFCRPVQSRGCMVPWIYTLPCKMGCSSRTDGSHSSMNGSKKRDLAQIAKTGMRRAKSQEPRKIKWGTAGCVFAIEPLPFPCLAWRWPNPASCLSPPPVPMRWGCPRGGLTSVSFCRQHQVHIGFMYTPAYVCTIEGYPSLSQTPSYNITHGQTPHRRALTLPVTVQQPQQRRRPLLVPCPSTPPCPPFQTPASSQ